ncbi:DciA family protein [Lolliginicoccus suaedae]|uniref:DciA family protein n=1 Tax=Lolliginicoccus suaedae TaxID=2605429 RepID=UPI0011F00FAE|nr:DciA family protein [Lolliginicoccus suaedae]
MQASGTSSEGDGGPSKGMDMVGKALARVRARSADGSGPAVPVRSTQPRSTQPRSTQPRSARPVRRGGWSSPRPDSRDPQALGSLANQIAKKRGWSGQISGGSVIGHWARIVGPDIAEHATPVRLEAGVLSVEAVSTAWATQLRYMQSQVLARIAESVGHGVVTSLRIHGPAVTGWRKGNRHVRGRGPRDTFG